MVTSNILFVPGNPRHVETQLPVAEILAQRGFQVSFLTRDSTIKPAYRCQHLIPEGRFPVAEFSGIYRSDVGKAFYSPATFNACKASITAFLQGIEFDVLVTCNDSSALFDRIVVDFSTGLGKPVLLIQESVRPWLRSDSTGRRSGPWLLDRKLDSIYRSALKKLARPDPAFFRRRYAHSRGIFVAAAGSRFRRQLVSEGLSEEQIRITGQPRIDKPALTRREESENSSGPNRTLLFCHQPVPLSSALRDKMVNDVLSAALSLKNVNVLFKPHPLDPEESYWRARIGSTHWDTRLKIVGEKSLAECLEQSDGMITIASTTCLEAMMCNVPVALIEFLPIPWYFPFAERNAAIGISDAGLIGQQLQILLFDREARQRVRDNTEAVLHDELYLRDGKSASRIADLIQLLDHKNTSPGKH